MHFHSLSTSHFFSLVTFPVHLLYSSSDNSFTSPFSLRLQDTFASVLRRIAIYQILTKCSLVDVEFHKVIKLIKNSKIYEIFVKIGNRGTFMRLSCSPASFPGIFRDAGTGGGGRRGSCLPCLLLGGARGAKVPFKYKEYYINSFRGAFS